MPPADDTLTAAPPDAPKGILAKFRHHILHPELTPEQVAWSFALGFALSWFPLIGTHTWIGLGLCLAFRRVHRPLLFLAMFINNPWTLVPYATLSAYAGNLLMGRGLALDLAGIQWQRLGLATFTSRAGFQEALDMLQPILGPYLLGGMALTLLALPAGYYAMRGLARRLRERQARTPSPRS